MFTIYNKGKRKVEVTFESYKPVEQVNETLVKVWKIKYGNKTTITQMKWVPIESGKNFDFNMKILKPFECGNVKMRYWSLFFFKTEKDLQHKKGKGMVITEDGELEYCEMENLKEGNKVSSSVCSIL